MGKQSALPKDMDRNQSHKENESITMGFWIFPNFRPAATTNPILRNEQTSG